MNNTEETLPTFAAYKLQCQDSSVNWLAYQSTLSDVRLVEFHPDGKIKQIYAMNIGAEQPLKSLRLVYSKQAGMPYLALNFHAKYTIFKKNDEVISKKLELTKNIADFDNGFVASQGVNDGMQIYFMFVTRKGKITTVPVDKLENTVEVKIDTSNNISCLSTKNSVGYLGTE